MHTACCVSDRSQIRRGLQLMDEPSVGELEELVRNMPRLLRHQRETHPALPAAAGDDLQLVEYGAHPSGCCTRNERVHLLDDDEDRWTRLPIRHVLALVCFQDLI